MPSNGTGHAKNVFNFETLITVCSGYGDKYNPSTAALKVVNLKMQYAAADAVTDDCIKTETIFSNATNLRGDTFAGIKPFSTRIVNAFASCGVADSIIDSAKTINRKIQGQRSTPLPEPKKAEDGTDLPLNIISSSQQGFDDFVEHISKLIELVSSQPEYAPNEADLSVTSLNAYLFSLKQTNTAVKEAYTAWSTDRINRSVILYAAKTGLVDVALDVKKYVKSVFNASSAQYKQLSGLRFRNIKD